MDAVQFLKLIGNDYPAFVDRRAGPLQERSTRDRRLLGAIGLAGEAGEVLEHYKKSVLLESKPMDHEALVLELGDVFWYFTLIMIEEGISLTEIVEGNMAKLKERYGETG